MKRMISKLGFAKLAAAALGVMVLALVQMHWTFDLLQVLRFGLMFSCGLAIAYSFLLMLSSTSDLEQSTGPAMEPAPRSRKGFLCP